jgi:hypothetical protein
MGREIRGGKDRFHPMRVDDHADRSDRNAADCYRGGPARLSRSVDEGLGGISIT